MSTDKLQTPEEIIPFLSYLSLRDTHRELLKRRREEQDNENTSLWDDVKDFLQRGEAAGAFLDIDEERQGAQNLLDYWHNQLYHAGLEGPEAILAEFDPTTQPEIPDSRCPYIGLDAFNESNFHLFFGRSQLIEDLMRQVTVNRLVAAIGPSGSGKSSVVLAGLLPRLKKGDLPGSALWHYYPTIVPGSAPLARLARLLQPETAATEEWVPDQIEAFRENSEHLVNLIDQSNPNPAILTIDQFEETFTLCHDEEERRAFLDNILRLVSSRGQRHLVILTMRVDYESYLNKVPLFQSLFEQGQVRVAAMNGKELWEAIEKPADLVGLKFEEGLIDALVREIVGEPAALPLLQFTLLQLWDNRERNRVTWETYRRLGGVMQALANTADHVYNTLLPEEQVTARRILLRIVQPSAGLEFTRSRVPRRVLYQSGEANDRIDRVLEKLIQARLVRLTKGATPIDDQIEIAHEALVRNWPRLGEWLEEAAVSLRQRQRLLAQAEHWDRLGRDDGALLRGGLLADALQYDDLSPLESEFVKASEEAKAAEEREKERIRQRELEQAKALAQEQIRVAQAERERADARKREAVALQQRTEALELAARRNRLFNIALLVTLGLAVGAIFLFVQANRQQADKIAALNSEATAVAAQSTAVAAQSMAEAGQSTAVVAQSMAEAGQSTAVAGLEIATVQIATSEAFNVARSTEVAKSEETAVASTATAQFVEALNAQMTATAQVTPSRASGSLSQSAPTATPSIQELMDQYALDAQLKAIVRERDNATMLYITGGTFAFGTDDDDRGSAVTLNSFYIDQAEVTVRRYAGFLNAIGSYRRNCDGGYCVFTGVETLYTSLLNNLGTYEARPSYETTPVNQVSWAGAAAYCEWVGGRLPTEAEWEYAARGLDGRIYPWGNTPEPNSLLANYNISAGRAIFNQVFAPFETVNALPDGASPFGVYAMSGGVMEWVEDWYSEDAYADPDTNGAAYADNSSGERVLRGGFWNSAAADIRTTSRFHLDPELTSPSLDAEVYWGVGFRCVRDVTN
ncbi:MAG: SUMF1/EgtB/PvdO family nonheme iron enzyme [Anaerolineales bacterium]|nr:SUMF1/EgtB/PvdO family nonheme iron enzyme [Anaerolineales bacterium]